VSVKAGVLTVRDREREVTSDDMPWCVVSSSCWTSCHPTRHLQRIGTTSTPRTLRLFGSRHQHLQRLLFDAVSFEFLRRPIHCTPSPPTPPTLITSALPSSTNNGNSQSFAASLNCSNNGVKWSLKQKSSETASKGASLPINCLATTSPKQTTLIQHCTKLTHCKNVESQLTYTIKKPHSGLEDN